MKKIITCPEIDGKKEVFCRYIVKNGKRIYPKYGRFFHFYVDVKTEEEGA